MVEGIELRNAELEGADAVTRAESNISIIAIGKIIGTSPESVTMAR